MLLCKTFQNFFLNQQILAIRVKVAKNISGTHSLTAITVAIQLLFWKIKINQNIHLEQGEERKKQTFEWIKEKIIKYIPPLTK